MRLSITSVLCIARSKSCLDVESLFRHTLVVFFIAPEVQRMRETVGERASGDGRRRVFDAKGL